MRKTGLIFGLGQDSSYLSELLIEKGYKVIVVKRRSSSASMWRFSNVIKNENFILIEGDITDYSSVLNIISSYKPDEIYNLAAQSNVGTSFNQPILTWRVCAEGVLNILEVMKFLKSNAKLYQASSSEMFGSNYSLRDRRDFIGFENGFIGNIFEKYQDENTAFIPQSPYAIAKLAAHNNIKLYREAYGIWAVGGILFNHESPRRGMGFVTRKITSFFENHIPGVGPKIKLGNINSYRDWGYAKEYVEAMWLMLQQDNPKDYVIGTGKTHSVREFLEEVIIYHEGMDCYPIVEECCNIDENCKRPAEVPYLRADASLAEKELGWKPKVGFKELVQIMCREENGLE